MTHNDIDAFAELLRRYRFLTKDEAELQEELAGVFAQLGVEHAREHRLSAGVGRLDFLVRLPAGALAVEVKTRGAYSAMMRQILRYAGSDEVQGVLVITTLARLCGIPDTLHGKPARAFRLTGGVF